MKKLYLVLIGLCLLHTSAAQTKNTLVTFYTNMGIFTVEMYDTITPITSGNFVDLVLDEYYDGVIFHRVIDSFMIQGGDPTGTGSGGPGYSIPDEFDSSLSNIQTTISMANSGPNTGGSQFFINLVDNTRLDFDKPPFTSKHPVFGIVDSNFSVVQAIGMVPTDGSDRPFTDVIMDSLRVARLGPLDVPEQTAAEFMEIKAFPNPITSRSIISIVSGKPQEVRVTLFDQMGRKVYETDRKLFRGYNFITSKELAKYEFDAGLYFLRVEAGTEIQVKKLIVIE